MCCQNFVASFHLLQQCLFIRLLSPHLTYCNIIVQAPPNLTPFLSSKNGPSECALAHTAPPFAHLNILTLKDINKLLTGMYKCVNGLLPRTFSSYFTPVLINSIPDHAITSFYHSPAHRTLRHYGPRLWNSIFLSIKSKPVGQFKTSDRNLISQDTTMDMTVFLFRSLIILNL